MKKEKIDKEKRLERAKANSRVVGLFSKNLISLEKLRKVQAFK